MDRRKQKFRENGEEYKVAERRPKRQFDNQVLIIEAKGKSYAELLKEVKGKIKPEEVGDSVRDLKKTRNGITLKKEENLEKIKDLITSKDRRRSTQKSGRQ